MLSPWVSDGEMERKSLERAGETIASRAGSTFVEQMETSASDDRGTPVIRAGLFLVSLLALSLLVSRVLV